MRKCILLVLVFFTSLTAFAQDFSNKGKDFWVAYGYHQVMGPTGTGANVQDMVLYFATDQVTNITISIPSIGFTQNLTSGAGNNVLTSVTIPKNAPTDARIFTEGLSDRGIHITSDKPMVAYAHIYNQSVSGATILYPTNTLGRDYYSVNYKNWSNIANANCWFYVVATDTGTTTVKITPTGNTEGGWTAGITYTVNLTQGQVYFVKASLLVNSGCGGGTLPPCTSWDLTGSQIQSINNGSGCKKIAVFSGSGRISISCDNFASSSDNYMVQAMPKTAWGKKYLTLPANGNQSNNFYRICVSNPAAVVRINGVVTTLPLLGNFYYEMPITNQPQLIESDSAIMVAQYFSSQGECGNGNPGDPEVIYLSSVEQNINKVLWNATNSFNILSHHFNVVLPNTGTAISSFTLDGIAVPPASFIVHPQEPNYSYLRYQLTGGPFGDGRGSHIIQSDSGFNAIAYGFGNAESYGYNAGTNIKDLYQQIGVQTTYGIETTPSVCTNSPFRFKVSLPYIPDSMRWNFNGAVGMSPNNNTVYIDNTGNIAEDSFTVVNGRTIHWYSIPIQYSFSIVGVYPITITTFVPNAECGSVQDIDFDLGVSAPPIADFAWTPGGCVAEAYQFTETTPQFPKATYRFWWDFGDPGSGAANNSILRNPAHTFTAPGTYTVRYASITTPGCLSDTISHTVIVDSLPNATISGNTTVCINGPLQDITFTGLYGTSPYNFTYTINGGAPITVNGTGTTATIQAPTNVAGTFIYNLVSVQNQNPPASLCIRNITGQSVTVNITPDATATLTSAAGTDNQTVCINNPIINITYAIGGSGTGANVVFTPALPGVTGSYSVGVFTITGIPTLSGVFSYTVNTTGPCVTPQVSGTITVTADATLTLTSAAGSDNQTLCINTPLLVNITYAVGGTGTGGSVTGLPAGVTGIYAAGVITISGTPTAAGVFNYTVLTTGPCVIPTATGTITVTGDGTLTLTSAAGTDNQSLCINVSITNITYAVGGTGTGGSVSGLPPGVTGVFAGGVITISGAPTSTVGSPFTYTVTTTGPCVIPTATGTITVNPDASITLTSAPPTTAQELCRNSTIIDITYAIAGGGTGANVVFTPALPGVTGSYSAGVFTITGSPTLAGLFNYTVTTTGTCVQNSQSGSILVNQLPTANFSYTTPSCETRTISFTDLSVANSGNINRWRWDFGDGSPLEYTQNPTHVYASAGTYNVTLTDTTDLGCVSDPIANIPVTINNRPQAGYIIPEVCLSDTYAQFLDTSSIAVGAITAWEWYFDDPFATPGNPNISNLQNPTHSYTAVGIYDSVQLIVTSAAGCRDTIIQTLVVNGSNPYAIFSVNNPTTLCANDSVAVVEASTVFPGTITKIEIWFDNAVSGPPGPPDISDDLPFTGKVYRHLYPNFQSPLTRTFQIRYRAFSGGVCLDDSIRNITVNAAPLVQFNNMPDTCLLAVPFQITQASEIGAVPGTGVFSGPGVSPTGIFSPLVAGIGTHTILYTFTSTAAGCVDTMSNIITVLDTAHAAFTYITPSCEQTATSFTDISTAPATVTLSNTVWDFGDGTPVENHAPGSTFGHVFAAPGTYTVTMYNVSAYGCNSTVTSQTITVDPNHGISLNTGNDIQTVCINTAIAQIEYTLSGGATGATVTGLPSGVTASVTGNILTIAGAPNSAVGSPFTYTVLTTGNTCVVADTTGIITVEPDHTIAYSSGDTTQSVCVNTPIDPIVYDIGGGAVGVTIANLPPGVVYAVTGTTLTISGTPTTTLGGPVFNYAISTAGNTCVVATAAGSIQVNPYPVPNFTVDKPSYCIPNAVVGFIQGSTMPDGSPMTFSWDFGDGSVSSGVSPSHWYATEGPFNVKLTARSTVLLNGNVTGCAHDTTILLNTIHPQPKADFVFNKPGICIGDNVTITDNTDGKDGTVDQWHWDMGDGVIRTTNPVTYTYFDTSTYNITMYSINSHGCNSDTIKKSFTVHPYPHVNAGPDRFVLEGGSIQLETITFANDPQYTWTPDLYLTDSRIARPRVVNPKTDMTYRLTVTARGGCALSDEVFVKLLKFPVIPNTFTPNNDGINDKWRIDYLNTYPDNRVQIFTRNGNLVFESRGYDTPWDGTLKGKPLPFDTYYYIIEPGNGRDPITGYVTIIK